jgi:protein-S-isoprenylcysteine O-methyltransferase Ste14
MHTSQLVSGLLASGTWIGFASVMRSYFRYSDQRTRAKTWLILSSFVCTLTQIVTLFVVRPPGAAWFWSGIAVYALANGLFWWALAAHGKAHPAFAFIRVAPASLTTAGPYRLVRHPIYSAYLLAWCAAAIISAQAWLLVAVVWMGLFYVSAACQEERTFRTGCMAESYHAYRRRTGMFLPKITALFSASLPRS